MTLDRGSIDRINELTRISRQRDLTAAEQAERKRLRENYLRAFRAQLTDQLEHTLVEYPDHHREPLRKKHE